VARSFLILHGWKGSEEDHWQTWLAQRLRDAGEDVRYPELPSPSHPSADAWASALHTELAAMDGERTVVCHSLACLLWAREAARIAERGAVERVLLVAPPCPVTPISNVRDFHPTPLDPEAVAASAGVARVVGTDNDPYCPAGAQRSFAGPLDLPFDLIPGAGHLNVEAGYGPWPAVEVWCLDGAGGALGQVEGAKNGVET
jgi:predicted alpha/beta hydrolase family esterase